jgi:ubiquinone/menaquinone biosynthesis C-methylase UbiE
MEPPVDRVAVNWSSFNDLAPSYDRWHGTPLRSFVDGVERRAVLGFLQPRPGELVLDVGSGTGRLCQRLTRRGVRCVGLEPSRQMLSVAQATRGHGNPWYIRGVAERLPLASGVFDAVTFVTTLEFVSDVDAALVEAARVAKPGARLLLGVLNSRGPWAAWRRRSRSPLWQRARFFHAADVEQVQQVGAGLLRHLPYGPGLHRDVTRLSDVLQHSDRVAGQQPNTTK